MSFLERYASLAQWMEPVSTRNPFHAPARADAGNWFRLRRPLHRDADLAPSQPGVLELLRQYLKLGGKLLGFDLDPQFAGAPDGLILVDLTQTEPRLLERYLGKGDAARFLASHRAGFCAPSPP